LECLVRLAYSVPAAHRHFKAGDPVTGSDVLGSDCGQREMVGKAVASADKCVRRPLRPTITRAKDPIETDAFAVFNDVGESLVALASFTGRLEQILEFKTIHIFGKSFVERTHIGPETMLL